MEREQKLQALANYLEVDADYFEEEGYDPNKFESKEYNESYVVLTEEEAREYAKRDIVNLFDDIGMNTFKPDFQQWIKDNALKQEYFEDILNDCNQSYIDDIENEYDEVFENHLISELVENGILTEDDFENWGEDSPMLDPNVDLDDKKREYLNQMLNDVNDPIQVYLDNYGSKAFVELIKEEPSIINMKKVVEECIRLDGIAHFVAKYDGNEHDLGNGLYAYRVN